MENKFQIRPCIDEEGVYYSAYRVVKNSFLKGYVYEDDPTYLTKADNGGFVLDDGCYDKRVAIFKKIPRLVNGLKQVYGNSVKIIPWRPE